jgi:hypothetical protein
MHFRQQFARCHCPSFGRAFSGALCATTGAGNMPLHEACCHASDWEKEILFVIERGSAPVRETNQAGQLALHEACIAEAPLGVMECLVQAHSEALFVTDNVGQLPSHLACVNHITVGALQFLLRHNKPAVGACDRHRKTLLVRAWQTNAPLDLVFLLFSKNQAKALNSFSRLPTGGGSDHPERKRQRRT